jgi:tellurite resistance protein TerC
LRSNRDEKVLMKSLQQTKRFLKILFGFTLLVAGILMIVTPGPGWLTIMLALGVLAAEFVWARRLLDRMKEQRLRLRDSVLPREKPGSA